MLSFQSGATSHLSFPPPPLQPLYAASVSSTHLPHATMATSHLSFPPPPLQPSYATSGSSTHLPRTTTTETLSTSQSPFHSQPQNYNISNAESQTSHIIQQADVTDPNVYGM